MGNVTHPVLIVARTRMGSSFVCVGGFDLETKENIRLLDTFGHNQSSSCQFQIGQVWNVTFSVKDSPIAPHNEDVLVMDSRLVENWSIVKVFDYIYKNAKVERGRLETLFQGSLKAGNGGALCVCRNDIPTYSVSFWETDEVLEQFINFDKVKYKYESPGARVIIPYVGTDQPLKLIESPGLVRVSLARWWTPPGGAGEQKCYLQLSGWF